MRNSKLIPLLLPLFLSASVHAQAPAGKEIPWFDTKQCAFCKNFAEPEGLAETTACETFKIDNGMLMVAFVPDHLQEAMKKANEGIQDTVKELESGKLVPMCGFCMQIGMLMQKGVKMQKVGGGHSEVSLFTSEDPETVKLIHTFADRVIKETAAMKARQKGDK